MSVFRLCVRGHEDMNGSPSERVLGKTIQVAEKEQAWHSFGLEPVCVTGEMNGPKIFIWPNFPVVYASKDA